MSPHHEIDTIEIGAGLIIGIARVDWTETRALPIVVDDPEVAVAILGNIQ